jgi:hypothetical protein
MVDAITEFTSTERRSLAIVVMSIDDMDPGFRNEALPLIDRLANLDDVTQNAFADAVETLATESRTKELITYLRSGRPLADLREEIFEAIDKDES